MLLEEAGVFYTHSAKIADNDPTRAGFVYFWEKYSKQGKFEGAGHNVVFVHNRKDLVKLLARWNQNDQGWKYSEYRR